MRAGLGVWSTPERDWRQLCGHGCPTAALFERAGWGVPFCSHAVIWTPALSCTILQVYEKKTKMLLSELFVLNSHSSWNRFILGLDDKAIWRYWWNIHAFYSQLTSSIGFYLILKGCGLDYFMQEIANWILARLRIFLDKHKKFVMVFKSSRNLLKNWIRLSALLYWGVQTSETISESAFSNWIQTL